MKKIPLRTPEQYFETLADYPFAPHYLDITHPDYQSLRMHYIDERGAANRNAADQDEITLLLLHGCPAWSYLYRKVIHSLLTIHQPQRRLRIIAPDYIGCGKSDKLLQREDYSYDFYVHSIQQLLNTLDLTRVVLVGQDWGGPIGLRVWDTMPERFSGIFLSNTLLPNCQEPPQGITDWPGEIITQWVNFTRNTNDLSVSKIIQGVCRQSLAAQVLAAYDAPFPDARYKQGLLHWPSLIPQTENMPGIEQNRHAWWRLEHSTLPLLTAFSDGDPSTIAWEKVFQHRASGAQHQPHAVINNAGHMVQEDQGEKFAELLAVFIDTVPRSYLPSTGKTTGRG